MKQNIIMIISILILLAGGLIEIKYLEKTSLYISSDIDYIKNAINNNKFDEAKAQMQKTYSSWERVEKIWNIFVNNNEVDEIEDSMIEIKENIELENKEECMVPIEKVKKDLEHTVLRQKLKVDNIL